MNLRIQQKLQTRQAIISAAMELSEEKGFSGLSLREVTRKAGIAPATFYRHFQNMNDLGLALVDQIGLVLRQLIRQARQRIQQRGSIVRTSVETFFEFLEQNPHLFRLLSSDRSGGPQSFQAALRKEKQRFIEELIEDIIQADVDHPSSLAYVAEVADLIINQVFYGGLEALEKTASERLAISEKLIIQIHIVFQGSKALRRVGYGAFRNNNGVPLSKDE